MILLGFGHMMRRKMSVWKENPFQLLRNEIYPLAACVRIDAFNLILEDPLFDGVDI